MSEVETLKASPAPPENATPWALEHLPPFSPVAMRLVQLLYRDNVHIRDVGEFISAEPVFSARVLQIANSPLFALAAAGENDLARGCGHRPRARQGHRADSRPGGLCGPGAEERRLAGVLAEQPGGRRTGRGAGPALRHGPGLCLHRGPVARHRPAGAPGAISGSLCQPPGGFSGELLRPGGDRAGAVRYRSLPGRRMDRRAHAAAAGTVRGRSPSTTTPRSIRRSGRSTWSASPTGWRMRWVSRSCRLPCGHPLRTSSRSCRSRRAQRMQWTPEELTKLVTSRIATWS